LRLWLLSDFRGGQDGPAVGNQPHTALPQPLGDHRDERANAVEAKRANFARSRLRGHADADAALIAVAKVPLRLANEERVGAALRVRELFGREGLRNVGDGVGLHFVFSFLVELFSILIL